MFGLGIGFWFGHVELGGLVGWGRLGGGRSVFYGVNGIIWWVYCVAVVMV